MRFLRRFVTISWLQTIVLTPVLSISDNCTGGNEQNIVSNSPRKALGSRQARKARLQYFYRQAQSQPEARDLSACGLCRLHKLENLKAFSGSVPVAAGPASSEHTVVLPVLRKNPTAKMGAALAAAASKI